MINLDLDITIRGAAFYHDEYVKVDGEWKFEATGYQRVYEEIESRKDTASLQVTDNMFVDTAG